MRSIGAWVTILGLIVGLGAGFVLANLFYRSESERRSLSFQMPDQTSPVSSLNNPQPSSQSNLVEESLSEEELRQAIKSAEVNQTNSKLQRDLGLALFHYAILEQKSDLLPDAVRLLERAELKASTQDRELYQTLGDALFVLASKKNREKMPRARAAYQKAFLTAPKDADLMVSIGLTFLNQEPSNSTLAIKHYYQALSLNPRHEKGLESLAIALLEAQKTVEAAPIIDKLLEVNPLNQTVNDLQTRLKQQQLINTKLNAGKH